MLMSNRHEANTTLSQTSPFLGDTFAMSSQQHLFVFVFRLGSPLLLRQHFFSHFYLISTENFIYSDYDVLLWIIIGPGQGPKN